MQYRIPTIALAAALIVACSENPTDPTELITPNFEGASGCYTVKFSAAGEITGPATTQTQLTGDLEGSATWVFDPVRTCSGVTCAFSGTTYWTITGGVIPGLDEFSTVFHQRAWGIDTPTSPPELIENRGTIRALSGVQIANLTYRGWWTAVPPPQHGAWDFQGIICP